MANFPFGFGGGAVVSGGTARVAFLLRQDGETDKGLLFSAAGISETGHLRGDELGDTEPALGGHADLPNDGGGPGVARHGSLRVQFPANTPGHPGSQTNDIVVRLLRNDGASQPAAIVWVQGSSLLLITVRDSTTLAQVRTALDAFSTFAIANSLTGAAIGTDNFTLGANLTTVDHQVQGGRDEIPPGIELIAEPLDEVEGPNILVKYDHTEHTLQDLLDALEENDEGVTIVVPFGTDLTAAPEEPPFTRGYHGGIDHEPVASPTSGLNKQQVDAEIRALAKAPALRGGAVWPESEIDPLILRRADLAGVIKGPALIGNAGLWQPGDIAATIARIAQIQAWAQVNNPALIPDAKLAATIARIAQIQAWARANNSDLIPDAKLGATIARTAQIASWARANNSDLIPDAKINSDIARVADVPSLSERPRTVLEVSGPGGNVVRARHLDGTDTDVTLPGAGSSLVSARYIQGTNEIVAIDRDGNETRDAVPSGGTNVVGNPVGTGGEVLRRLRVGTDDYRISSGYLFYTRPTLDTPADITSDTAAAASGHSFMLLDEVEIPGQVFDADFTTEWFGSFEFEITWTAGGNNDTQPMKATIRTIHAFNGKALTHERVMRSTPFRKGGFINLPMSQFNSVARVQLGDYTDVNGNTVTITEADLLGPTTVTYELIIQLERNGNPIAFTVEASTARNLQNRSYQIAHGAGALTPPPTPRPHISSFAATVGDLDPAAGSIAGDVYTLAWAIAQSDHAGFVDVIGYKGALADDFSNATRLLTVPARSYAHGTGQATIPSGVSLAAGETYTLRLRTYEEGVTAPAIGDTPTSYQNLVITAHAPAVARYHWGRLPRVENKTPAQYAADIVFGTTGSGTDLTTGTDLDTDNGYVATPGAAGGWTFYLAALASAQQPTGWTLNGRPAEAVFNQPVDQNIGGSAYKVIVMQDVYWRDINDGPATFIPTV